MRVMLTCLLAWLVTVSPVLGWNATGHKIIASIAFRRLTANEQAKIVGILRRHPRFTEDFTEEMPAEIRDGDETMQKEWLFQQAAVWPDDVRSGLLDKRAFNRSEWHYANVRDFSSPAQCRSSAASMNATLAEF